MFTCTKWNCWLSNSERCGLSPDILWAWWNSSMYATNNDYLVSQSKFSQGWKNIHCSKRTQTHCENSPLLVTALKPLLMYPVSVFISDVSGLILLLQMFKVELILTPLYTVCWFNLQQCILFYKIITCLKWDCPVRETSLKSKVFF